MAQPRQAIETVISDFRRLHDSRKQVVVALSGGVDSAAMLFCLSRIKADLQPVFVYHGIRSAEEENKSHDAALEACRRCDLFNMATWYEPKSRLTNCSTEAEAREVRYQSLAISAGENGTIATAHHADDQLETLLMRLCRGSGITGLAAIPPSSRIPVETKINCKVIRPMLRISKADCIEICECNDIPWHEDVTNSDMTITRNRLRHDVLPVLKELYPQCSLHASEAAFKLRDISRIIDSRVAWLKAKETTYDSGIMIEASFLREESDSVQAAYFRDVAKRLNKNMRMDRINTQLTHQLMTAIRQKDKKSFDWPRMKVETTIGTVSFTSASGIKN
tara:strand:- start:22254 stop:23258 length:1005 start_codon:yes stop_codon:yes gene_type:complete